MNTIEVFRGLGDRKGTDIVEPLLSDDMLIYRGIAEMDSHASQFNSVTLETVFKPGIRLGQLVTVIDPISPIPYRAKIVGIEIALENNTLLHKLNLERPR